MGLWVFVVGFYVVLDGLDQFFDTFEDSPANPFASDFAEPSLNQI
jgi:hypothetical protein